MIISDLAIKNRTASLVLAVALTIGGLLAYVALPKESQPQIEFAMIVVTTIYPGASPDDVESILSQEIEREVSTISGLDVLRSTSTEGVSTVIAEFLPDKDIAEASREVREAVDRAKVDFPSDVEDPIVADLDFADFPVLTVNMLTEGSLTQLRTVAEDLQDEIEGVPGVSGVDLIGGLEREVQVNVDLAALQGAGLTMNDVVMAVQTENTNIPGGSVDIGPENYLLRVNGEFDRPEEILDLVVAAPGGTPIYVRDLAEVTFGYKDRSSYARLQILQRESESGEMVPVTDTETAAGDGGANLQVIRLNVKKTAGENIIEVVDAVEEVIAAHELPRGVETVLTGDQSREVEILVKDLENNIIAGILFVVAVLLFFLGVRNATLVGLAIPLSMFVSFLVFSILGQTLNFIILFSLIIALGMLVDNAIVIVENIYRFREEGYDRWDAARLATSEVAIPVATSTLTTVAAFAPMLLWPGIIGKFMSYMPLTLIVTLMSSLFVALVLNPVITGMFMRTAEEEAAARARPRDPRMRRIAIGGVAFTALVVGLTNWKTLVFLAVAVPVVYLLHHYVLSPMQHRFAGEIFPRFAERYRAFLRWMLQRDYSMPGALRRNTFALGSFTLGFLLLVLGGALSAVSRPGGMLLLAPGGLLLVVGLLGIVVHALESAFMGGRTSVKAGLAFGAVVAVLVVLLSLGGRIDYGTIQGVEVVIGMFLLPGLIAGFGFLGTLFAHRFDDRVTSFGSRYWLLTDNRARLLTGTLSMLVAIGALFQVAPTGVEFFPATDPNLVQITAEAPVGTTIERSNEVADEVYGRVAALLADDPGARANTESIATSVGVGGDVMFGGGAASAERSQITLDLVDYEDRAEPTTTTLARIRERLAGLPGVDLQVEQDQNGPPTGAAVNIEIAGRDFAVISRLSDALQSRMEDATDAGRITGLVDVRTNLGDGRPEYRIVIDRERAAAFGLSTQSVALAVRGAVAGTEASTWRDGKDEYDITVRLRPEDRASLRQIESLTITDEGRTIPLTAVARVLPGAGPSAVTRLDQERVVTVMGDAAPGVNANALLAQVQAELAPVVAEAPAGYSIRYTGASEEQDESFGFLTTALLMGIALITIILIAQFNSIKNPFIIMVAVGLSLIGVLLGLILTRTPFGLMTFIGLISLAGIVVNNAIVLVDYIEELRRKGREKQDAVVEAGATRLRPVVLTALTTVIGLIPLTFGINVDFVGLIVDLDPAFAIGSQNTDFWGPMGTAIISGLTFATFLTLVIVPVMYSAFDSVAARLASRRAALTGVAGDGVATDDVTLPRPVEA